MSQGKGISDAVRGSILEWMTQRVIAILFEESMKLGLESKSSSSASLASNLRNSEGWVRIKRARNPKGGWLRTYYSKRFGKNHAGLTVSSNELDTHIEYVTVTLANKVIGGGRVRVPSLLVSQFGRNAAIEGFKEKSVFTEFSELELKRLSAELEFGEDSVLALLTEERL